MEKLESCLMCKSEEVSLSWFYEPVTKDILAFTVTCNNCGHDCGKHKTEKEAITAWNKENKGE